MYKFFFLFLSFPVYLAPWKKGLIAVVVIGVIIVTLVLGAKCYFLKKAKGEHSPFIPSCQAALPGNLPWRWGASASWEACALVQWEPRACGWWRLFYSWGVTFLTKDIAFGGYELLLPFGVSQAWVKAFAFWVGLPGKDEFGGNVASMCDQK